MTKKQTPSQPAIVNRRASFDYELGDELVVGMSLDGKQVRAARDGHVQLKGAFVTIRGGELWLNNASFSVKNNQKGISADQQRVIDDQPKKLLATKREISQLTEERTSGKTIVPKRILIDRKYIKLVIAIGRGKKLYDKRESLKRRDTDRETRRMIKRV